MIFTDSETGLFIADTSVTYDTGGITEIHDALNSMILSASGWRKIFAADEESTDERLKSDDVVLAVTIAKSFALFLAHNQIEGTIAVGIDSRPTGPALADIINRVLANSGYTVEYYFIIAAPELLAAVKNDPDISAFVYISASHNPVGYNGIKFGLGDGSVMGGDKSAALISNFQTECSRQQNPDEIASLLVTGNKIESIYENCSGNKKKAYSLYYDFIFRTAADSSVPSHIEEFKKTLSASLATKTIGIVAELNGSARGITVDNELLHDINVKIISYNDVPREIVHRIVPEGSSLSMCRELLAYNHTQDPDYIFGYVPDNDGDRGNIVYYSESADETVILDAQQVFAVAVLAELLAMPEGGKKAVVVNGPTSNRIDDIAVLLDVEVHRAEVGEANVVGTARELIEQGYKVRILGEGSNGGNITFPSTVRDPLNTLMSLLKIMAIPEYFKRWCSLTGNYRGFKTDFSFDDILASLPQYYTTSAYEPQAMLKISSTHKRLKSNYEKLFQQSWQEDSDFFKQLGIFSYTVYNYERTKTLTGFGNRNGKETGGLKIQFFDKTSESCAYVWMRGSGTEPVFRVLADSKESAEREKQLLAWHTSLIKKADAQTDSNGGSS